MKRTYLYFLGSEVPRRDVLVRSMTDGTKLVQSSAEILDRVRVPSNTAHVLPMSLATTRSPPVVEDEHYIGLVWNRHVYDMRVPFERHDDVIDLDLLPEKLREVAGILHTESGKFTIDLITGDIWSGLLREEIDALQASYTSVRIRHGSLDDLLPTYLTGGTGTLSSDDLMRVPTACPDHLPRTIDAGSYLVEVGDDDAIFDGSGRTIRVEGGVIYGLVKVCGQGRLTVRNLTIDAVDTDVAPLGSALVPARSGCASIRIENCHVMVRSIGTGGGALVGSDVTGVQCLGCTVTVRSAIGPHGGALIGAYCKDVDLRSCRASLKRSLSHPYSGGMIGSRAHGTLVVQDCTMALGGNITAMRAGGVVGPGHHELETVGTMRACSVRIGGQDGITGEEAGGALAGTSRGWTITESDVHVSGNVSGDKSGGIVGFGSSLGSIERTSVVIGGSVCGKGAGGMVGSTVSLVHMDACRGIVRGDVCSERAGGLCGYNVRIGSRLTSSGVHIHGDVSGDFTGGLCAAKPVVARIHDCFSLVDGSVLGPTACGLLGQASKIAASEGIGACVRGACEAGARPVIGTEPSSVMKRRRASEWCIVLGADPGQGFEVPRLHTPEDARERYKHVSLLGRQCIVDVFRLRAIDVGEGVDVLPPTTDMVTAGRGPWYLNIYEPGQTCSLEGHTVTYEMCSRSRPDRVGPFDAVYTHGGACLTRRDAADPPSALRLVYTRAKRLACGPERLYVMSAGLVVVILVCVLCRLYRHKRRHPRP